MQNNRTIRFPSPMACYVFVVLGALIALSAALYMQHAKGLQPCTMCIIQRYAFVLMGLFSSLAILLPFKVTRIVCVAAGFAGALIGIIAAIRNLWVMSHPEILCGRDPIEIFLNTLPTAHWFPKVFLALGLCSDPIPPLFGLALPTWSLLGLVFLAALLGISLRRR